jgi:folate-dependent tRNA-U54 methylase TrmFO/GidA
VGSTYKADAVVVGGGLAGLTAALEIASSGRPVIVGVKIDYARKSAFTEGVVKTNLARFTMRQKLGMVGRAVIQHTGCLHYAPSLLAYLSVVTDLLPIRVL